MRQLAFDLPHRAAMGRSDFIISGSNTLAVAEIERWDLWSEGRLALLGPEGAGKTHLAQVFAALTGARTVSPLTTPLARPGAIILEDLDRLADPAAVSEPLFHLLNAQRAAGQPVLLTGRTPPLRWRLGLADLASRLAASSVVRIEPPDDALLAALLRKLFDDRQLACPDPVIRFLVPRIERSYKAAQRVVARMDALALDLRHEISVALAVKALAAPA
ncbi:MAG: DnaA/Hda family protein [Pseudomonadota bacterium]